MSDVLEAVLSIFDCDRSWLVHPCDPDAASWTVPRSNARPISRRLRAGRDLPVDPEIANVFQTVRASSSPVRFGPGEERPLPAKRRSVQHPVMLAWRFTQRGQALHFGVAPVLPPASLDTAGRTAFQEIGRRLEDALTAYRCFAPAEASADSKRPSHLARRYWERRSRDQSLHLVGRKLPHLWTCAPVNAS